MKETHCTSSEERQLRNLSDNDCSRAKNSHKNEMVGTNITIHRQRDDILLEEWERKEPWNVKVVGLDRLSYHGNGHDGQTMQFVL